MANFLTSINQKRGTMTRGERRLADRMAALLEDDYLIWHEAPIGPRRQQPDFVILHPRRGVLALEVKDWKLESLHEANRQSITLSTQRGLVRESNPLDQARLYAIRISRELEQEASLLHPPGHPRAGKLMVPWGFGVVLSNITRQQLERSGLDQMLAPD
ncbi:nuclease-related domain-containing protein, partial [Natronospira sp.]